MSDDLVEHVARAMAVGDHFDPDWITNNDTPNCPQPVWCLYRHSARAAIAVALEEAAKVADDHRLPLGDFRAPYKIAAAIRALITKENK